MRHIGLAVLVYTAAVARTSIVPRLGLEPAPDALLALAFFAALIGGVPGVLWGAVLGLVSDAIAPSGMGIDVFWTTLFVWLAQRWLRRRPGASIPAKTTLAFAFSACLVTATVLTRSWLDSGAIDAAALAATAATTALVSAALVVSGGLLLALPRHILPAHWTGGRQRQQAW